MAPSLPAITGKQLIRLLRRAGWEKGRRLPHGIAFSKVDVSGQMRVTTIPDKRSAIPPGTLAAILGLKQTNLGRAGLVALIATQGI